MPLAPRDRAADGDHDEPPRAGGADLRPLPAARARPGAAARQGDRLRRRGQGDRARPLGARRARRAGGAPAPQCDRPWGSRPRRRARRRGKPRGGMLTLAAARDRSAVLITVRATTARGSTARACCSGALELGLVEAGTSRLDDAALMMCIAHPGFSTKEQVTEVSGARRGDRRGAEPRARALGGSLGIETEPGKGTSVTIRLPVTLAIVRALLARVGDERYALPLTHVRETMERRPTTITQVQGKEVFVLRDEVLPDPPPARRGAAVGREGGAGGDRGDRARRPPGRVSWWMSSPDRRTSW
jgi:hypothetical protein